MSPTSINYIGQFLILSACLLARTFSIDRILTLINVKHKLSVQRKHKHWLITSLYAFSTEMFCFQTLSIKIRIKMYQEVVFKEGKSFLAYAI